MRSLLLVTVLAVSSFARAAGLVVPLCAYPTATNALWNATASAAASVPVVAIVNPANGPGAGPDTNYSAGMRKISSAGVSMLGYVPTAWGDTSVRSYSMMTGMMDTWAGSYQGIRGIFFDEASTDLAKLNLYADIASYAHGKGFSVWFNPGTSTPTEYLSLCDTCVTFESSYTAFKGVRTANPAGYSSDHYASLITSAYLWSFCSAMGRHWPNLRLALDCLRVCWSVSRRWSRW